MKKKCTLVALALMLHMGIFAQDCGHVFVDNFSNTTTGLPAGWTEYNTNGQVTVVDESLQFDYTASLPSARRSFDAETQNLAISFDVSSTRNWVKCRFDLLSSTGKYIAGLLIGNDAVKNIQYATALDEANQPTAYAGALIDGDYNKSTVYSIRILIDFESKTLSFYQGGQIRAVDIAFLDDVSDVAQVDISQVSMYGSEGRFYFDNLSLAYQTVDPTGLATTIAAAQEAISGVILSPKYGYTQAAYWALKDAIDEASPLLSNCEATETQLALAEAKLAAAKAAFDASFKDETVLTLYASYSFTNAQEYTCGYYNGTLGDFEDKAVAFRLEQGYMATFAQDVDGKGASKVFIAQDEALQLILPEALQRSISFVRVSPWFEKQKKGSCGKGADVQDALGSEWYYAWGMENGYSTTEREFVPMSWSGGTSHSSVEKTQAAGQNMSFNHHLAFNEPDLEEQSNMTVEKALEVYPNLFASGLRLGSPAVSHGGLAWINAFMDGCVEKGYRVDFIAIHDYVRRTPTGYYNRYKALYDKYKVPIWVTEYNYGNPGMGSPVITDDVALAKLKDINQMMDTCSFIERYAMFYFQPNQGQLSIFETRNPIVFNTIGTYYRDHQSPDAYQQEVYENGPQIFDEVTHVFDVQDGVSIFPNPVTQGILNLRFRKNNAQAFSLQLYDVHGKEVLTQQLGASQLNVGGLQSGFYTLRIQSNDKHIVRKILIQNP